MEDVTEKTPPNAASKGGPTPQHSYLPQVTDADAATLRREVKLHRFVPTTNRLPDQVLPAFDFITILDQGPTGMSVGAAVAGVLNYLRAEAGEQQRVSARMLYDYARVYDEFQGSDHEGSTLIAALAALERHGVCLESEWPIGSPKGPISPVVAETALQNRPAAIRVVERSVNDLRAAVFEQHAAAVAATAHEGWMKPREGVITGGGGRRRATVLGGHAFAVIGYTPDGFIVQNSWGPNWGNLTLDGRTYPGVALWPYEDAKNHLGEAWVLQLARRPFRPPLVGYDADSLEGDDLLEIRAEVNAFSYVLASLAIKPPMALGLFGDWGSGKSFFMQEMRRKIADLAERQLGNAEDPDAKPTFCKHIVQIHFNAWHYLDTDLWASLVTEIFDQLFSSIRGKVDRPEDKLPQLEAELQAANGVYQKAKQQLDEAQSARASAEQVLAGAIKAREEKEGALETQLDDISALVAGNASVQESVHQLASVLGVPELEQSYAALEARAADARTLARRPIALLQVMFSTPWGWVRLATLLAAAFAPMVVVFLIELVRTRWPGAIRDFHSFALQVSALFGALTTWLGVQVKRGSVILAKLDNTDKELEKIRAERRKQAVAKEQGVLAALHEREDAARKGLQEAEQRVQTLQREIADLQPGRLIMRFIEERSRSTDYRSRLGIVSLVRRDFERLSELADPDSARRKADLMPVERMILYIDDLDRCRPDRVIEVLEAVHLLLAFKLFMVVVAVDPRWLRHCLEKQYPDLLAIRLEDVSPIAHTLPSRPATAQDYLEKIFQIPFTLQSLRTEGYRRMVRGLTVANVAPDAPTPVVGSAATPAGAGVVPPVTPAGSVPASGDVATLVPMSAGKSNLEEDEDVTDERTIARLNIRAWELEDIEQLAPLFRTPRAVKRFVNTYRFLRAGVRPHELALFEGSRDEPGTYRAAQLLLAIVVSFSNVAPRLLRRILDTSVNGGGQGEWTQFLKAARDDVGARAPGREAPVLAPKGGRKGAGSRPKPAPPLPPARPQNWEEVEWQRLCDVLLQEAESESPVASVGELAEWIPIVARYSFTLAAGAALEQ